MVLIASAVTVTSQSNLNCSVYNRSEVPAGFVGLINMYQGNDSHAEYGNLTNYNWTVACESNITTLDYGCGNNYINVVQLYDYTDAHASVDSYYNRSVCFNTSNNSLLWVSQLSNVGSPIPDGFECVFAVFNQSNSHVYACNNSNASYNVNLRISAAPLGSIVIVGPNGTELTGTRSVFLNLTYSSGIGIDKCRWANDDLSDLDNAMWEECTTVKAWLLGEEEGNKTVYYQIRDILNNTATLSDSIVYYYTLDYTAPTPPIIYDGLEDDIDWWNDNTTLHAHWFNATEDMSEIYYRYRIMENSSCYNNDCNFTDAGQDTSVTVTGLTLEEGATYSFEVQAYSSFNLSSSTAASNGTRIDVTPPNPPNISSTTHPDQETAYAISGAEFNWTATDILSNGNMSGIEGYSYILDSYPGTAPDNIMEDRYWETLSTLKNNGYEQLLRANGSTPSPHTYAVFSQLKVNFTENDSIRVRVALAEIASDYDDLMGVEVYLMKNTEGAAISAFSQESKAISNIANVSWDIEYAADMTLATIYQFNLTVNETVDDNTDDIYVVISGLTGDNDNRNNLSIAGSTQNIDSSTRNFVCNNTPSCAENTQALDYAIEVKRADSGDGWSAEYGYLGDGTYYFHVKAKDKAGNWGDTEHYRIIIAAGGVSIAIASPADGEVVTTDGTGANISVKVMVSGNASVRVTAEHPDGSSYTSSEEVFSTTHVFSDITLELGTNKIYAIANTSSGATTQSSSVYVIVASALVPVTDKTLRVSYAGCTPSADPYICYAAEGSNYVGVATETEGSIPGGGGYAQADTTVKTIKIFMSREFNADDMDDYFADDDFLDLINPSFSYGRKAGEFVIQNELRYEDVHVGGDYVRLAPGKYLLYLNHHGVTADGRVNLTISVE